MKLTSDEATFMLNKAVAISTLAVLAAGDLTHQAIASPDLTNSSPKPAASNYAIPVQASPAKPSTASIAPPEAVLRPEFSPSSQTPVSTSPSNVVVTATPQSPPSARTPISSSTQSPSVNTPAPSTRTAASTTTNDLAVTATDVQVTGATDELQQIALKAIALVPVVQPVKANWTRMLRQS